VSLQEVVLFSTAAGKFAPGIQRRMANQSALAILIISGVSVGIGVVMWITFHSAGPIARRLGPIGMNIITRVMGILVTATAFGLLGRGIGGLLPGLAK